jgi:hypothetical protein
MKKAALLLACLLFLTSCIRESKTQYAIEEDQVYLVITRNTTREELAQIAAVFKKERNIDIDYSKSKFSANGKISEVNLEVDCNDGFKGSTHCSGSALKFKNIGFVRDYQPNSGNAFHIGSM